jgi:hypothetical protein
MLMNVTFVTFGREGDDIGAAGATRSACAVPALVGEPSTACGDFFTYLAM